MVAPDATHDVVLVIRVDRRMSDLSMQSRRSVFCITNLYASSSALNEL